ncbi:MAG: tyrosine-type recombinase/integrase [Spirochaetes bacterium]|jgi:integrase/recombinase XerC|nr:tyrosine-type recombinase/integrase [Spirochaetota bacterium]
MDPLSTHVESFLQHIRIERNYSPATEHSYRSALALLLRFLADTGASVTDKHSVNGFIRYLKERGSSDVTIAHRLAVLKSFFSYLVAGGIVRKRTLPVIEKYKTTRKIISIPSDSEVNLFLKSIEEKYRTSSDSLGAAERDTERHRARRYSLYRDLVLFSLIAATGLRISEALRIKHADLNWSDFSIRILGKGSRERIIYFGIERLKLLLAEFVRMSEELGVHSPHLFVSYQRRQPLTPRYLQKVMKTFLTESCCSRCTPHTLRHYYATRSIERGANIKAIAMLLGHANITTTLKMYCHLSAQHLRQTFETLNPFSAITLSVEQIVANRYQLLVNL